MRSAAAAREPPSLARRTVRRRSPDRWTPAPSPAEQKPAAVSCSAWLAQRILPPGRRPIDRGGPNPQGSRWRFASGGAREGGNRALERAGDAAASSPRHLPAKHRSGDAGLREATGDWLQELERESHLRSSERFSHQYAATKIVKQNRSAETEWGTAKRHPLRDSSS